MSGSSTPDPLARVALRPIETDRLTVRLTEPGDTDAFLALLSQPEVCRFLLHDALDRAGIDERLARTAGRDTLRCDGEALRLTAVRRFDGVVLGELVLIAASVADATVEIGWVLHPDHQGQGYAAEAARGLLGFAFHTLRTHRVVARLHPGNTASAALCTRLGLRREAHHRRDVWVKGGWEDTVVYAMLAEEHRH